ncbi:Phosphoglycerate dehydrogenase [Halogranum amylolyticum]|uniref:Phosphoglycerate dehydrogenase n=1 Tax=Halogranum amylolyticum TaxID=660520 RepID=A0A1H8RRH0_9EURY|nr:D-2-hydroxyacid dehydrogenase [Halogranum amylolyticum]SEO68758.1 Phosphoglycerate dehydrogenase [Halogranum amylolyticum]
MTDADIAVLRQKIHGMPAEGYIDALRERLPDREIVYARTPDEERELLRTVPVAAGFTLPTELLDEVENLQLFACSFAGTGHLPMEELEDHGVAVTNASGVHGPNIAEHVLGSILGFARGFHTAWRRKERTEWRSFQTHELQGSTVAIVGLGAIGQAVVDRLDPFGVDTVGVRYSPEKGGPTDEVLGFDDLHDALGVADYVVVAAPLTDETEGMFDANAFKTMKPDSVLINIGRGPIVDTDALVSTLETNGIRGASLDVTDPEPLPRDHPLWTFDNVLVTPHNAGHTPAYWERLADILARNVKQAEELGAYEELENQVV